MKRANLGLARTFSVSSMTSDSRSVLRRMRPSRMARNGAIPRNVSSLRETAR